MNDFSTIEKNSYDSALKLIREGQLYRAELILKQLVKSGTTSVNVFLVLGDCMRNQGNIRESAQWYRSAVNNDTGNFTALCNYGSVLRELKEFSEAELYYHKAIEVDGQNPVAYANLGLVFLDNGKPHDASECFSRALQIDPHHILYNIYLIRSLLISKKMEKAIASQNRLIDQNPDSSQCFIGLGNIYMEEGLTIEAKDFYVKALRIQPDSADAHYNLGVIMRQWDNLDEAVTCFRNSMNFNKKNIFAPINLGETFQVMGEHHNALQCFHNALQIDPSCQIAHDNCLVSMNYDSCYSNEEIFDAHIKWAAMFQSKIKEIITFSNSKDLGRKIKIGYISSDFCKHPVASFIEPVIANHDRCLFEIYCYNQHRYCDERTERFRQLADVWRDITSYCDYDAAELIRNDQIDILIDCTGHMAGNRLGIFANRGAPIQISGFGYPSTTGLSSMDYYIADPITDLQNDFTLYSEKLLFLERGFFCYMPPVDAPDIGSLPLIGNGFITFGSLHTTARLNRDLILLWAEILNIIKNSRLIIFRTTLTKSVMDRLTKLFSEAGIDLGRIDFRNKIESGNYLSIYQEIDCSLDTFPWSGHTTACESLWMGVPIITLRGKRHAGRMVTSLLERVGLTGFIANTLEDYLSIAANVNKNHETLIPLRASLRNKVLKSSVCDSAEWVKAFEKKLHYIWNEWCRGKER